MVISSSESLSNSSSSFILNCGGWWDEFPAEPTDSLSDILLTFLVLINNSKSLTLPLDKTGFLLMGELELSLPSIGFILICSCVFILFCCLRLNLFPVFLLLSVKLRFLVSSSDSKFSSFSLLGIIIILM